MDNGRNSMKIRMYTTAIISTLLIVLAPGCKDYDMGIKFETYMVAMRFSEKDLGTLLHDYFAEEEISTEKGKEDFVKYAVKGELFADFPPPKGYESPSDLSFYLIWPDSLNSRNPQLIAYTQPFNKENDKKQEYRCLLFFRQNEPVAVIMQDGCARGLIGAENLGNDPDLYLWADYLDYMVDQRRQ